MWGQSTATKVLFDSLIAEKVDDCVIIGRGIPAEWNAKGKVVEIKDVSVDYGKKTGYKMTGQEGKITLELTGDKLDIPYSLQLISLKNNIASVNVDGKKLTKGINRKAGTITIPAGSKMVVVNLGEEIKEPEANPSTPVKGSTPSASPSSSAGNNTGKLGAGSVAIDETKTPTFAEKIIAAIKQPLRNTASASNNTNDATQTINEEASTQVVDDSQGDISEAVVEHNSNNGVDESEPIPAVGEGKKHSRAAIVFAVAAMAIAGVAGVTIRGRRKIK